MVDEEAGSPAEGLPDGFGDEGHEGVGHDEEVFEGGLEEREVFVDFLAFEEPVGVFVPDGGVDELDGFGEAVVDEVFFEVFVEAVEFAADPVFAHG